jgi:hypothetical protein
MNRHVSTSKSRRQASGPSIEWLDADGPPSADSEPARRTSPARSGIRILPGPVRSTRLQQWVGLAVLLLATLGIAVGVGVYMTGRDAAAEPDVATAVPEVEPFVEPQPAGAPVVPPPSDLELAALESGPEHAMADALRALRKREVTPAGLRAVAIAARRTEDVELQRRATCYRIRGGAPLDEAFAALPTEPPADAEWKQDGAACLVEAIAVRASEAPERALPVLLDRAFVEDADPIVDGLAQLNLPALPVSVVEALDSGRPQTRRTAIRIAIALGAAARWPERVASWLQDKDRAVRLFAHAELLRRHDDDSRRLAARAIAANPADDELSRRAVEQIAKGDGFDRQLADVAADVSQPAAVRAHAAGLVGTHGGPAACRVVVAIASAEPGLASELAETRLRIDQRFGTRLRRPDLRR